MKKTNVFLEIEDNVYNYVVEPHKKAKTFSKLIAALLKGYIEDEYVRAYGDELVDDLRKASVNSLDETLGSMHESLANMGLFTDELQLTSRKGKDYFSNKKKESIKQKEYSCTDIEDKDVEELKEDFDALKVKVNNLNSQNLEILSILQSISKNMTDMTISATSIIDKKDTYNSSEKVEIHKNIDNTEVQEENIVKENIKDTMISHSEAIEEVNESKERIDMGFLNDAMVSF